MTGTSSTRSGDQLRGELLTAATDLLSQRLTVNPPSLRDTARACGVSATAVYRHFPSQQALLLAVAGRSLAALEDAIAEDQAALAVPGGNLEAVRTMAITYTTWAVANPGAYQLLFEARDLLEDGAAIEVGIDRLQQRLGASLAGLPAGNRDAATQTELLWIALHGLVVTRIRKAAHPWPRRVAEDTARLVEAFTTQTER
jgi:AcrR family transcriptional regulator